MTFAKNNFWGKILRSSTEGKGLILPSQIDLGETKISDADVAVSVEEHILWLQISVKHASRVQVAQRFNELCSINPDPLLREPVLRSQISEQLTSVQEVNHKIQLRRSLERIVKLDDVGRFDLLED